MILRGTRPWGSSPWVTLTYGRLDHEEILWGLALPIGPGSRDAEPTRARMATWFRRWTLRFARCGAHRRKLWVRRVETPPRRQVREESITRLSPARIERQRLSESGLKDGRVE